MNGTGVDFAGAREHAGRLEQAASGCGEAAAALRRELASLAERWSGPSADAFAAALARRCEELEELDGALERLAARLRGAADAFAEKDRTARAVLTAAGKEDAP